ncbi:MAG TPA: bifunctional metallophosphatase/5'-nucleotidase, partial [Archangium sp.]
YIARGGSGFLVLKRNTTRVETGIPLRDSLIGYMTNYCSCDELLAGNTDADGNIIGAKGQPCGERDPENLSKWSVDAQELSFCTATRAYVDRLNAPLYENSACNCANIFRKDAAACPSVGDFNAEAASCLRDLPDGPTLGRCSCREALSGATVCGNVTRAVRNFCENPTRLPIAVGAEDGRISRRVK